jgi:hypothetical protein
MSDEDQEKTRLSERKHDLSHPLSMGTHSTKSGPKWLKNIDAEHRWRPVERQEDGFPLAVSIPREFAELADIYIDCMMVAVFASPAARHTYDALVVECFLIDASEPTESAGEMWMCFKVFVQPSNMPFVGQYSEGISEVFQTAATAKKVETKNPQKAGVLWTDANFPLPLPFNYWMQYPGFMKSAACPRATGKLKRLLPRYAVRAPKTIQTITDAIAVNEFLQMRQSPPILFKLQSYF